MKKLFSLLTLALLTMSAWAANDVTIDFSAQGYGNQEDFDNRTVTINGVSLTFSKGEGTVTPKYFTSGTSLRLYGGNTMAVAASENITKIVFTYSSGAWGANSADSGEYANGAWTGSAQNILFTNGTTAQIRIQKMVVTLGEGGTTPDPEPEPKTYAKVTSVDQLVAGQKYIIVDEEAPYAMASIGNNGGLAASVAINSGIISTADALEFTLGGTPEAASFSYDNNGTTTYMAPANKSLSASTDEYAAWVIDTENFTLSATIGETVYTLRFNSTATSGPFRTYSTTTGRVVYLYVLDENATPVDPTENLVESLEIAADMADGVEFTFTGNAGVSYQKGAYLWLRDETGYGLIYGQTNGGTNPVFTPGTVLAPNWKAKTSIYNDELMEFVSTTGLDSIGFNAAYAEPQTINELSADMINAYVQVLNVKSLAASGRNVTATLADGTTMVMYNQFDVDLPTTEGNYTVLGAVSTHNGLQLMIFSIEGNFVVAPTLPASCDFEGSKTIEITCNDEDATVMYGYDGTTWTEYTEALTITETTTVYAKAVKGDIESEVVSATYTKVDPAEMVTYTLVTDASQLANGDKIILVGFNQVDSVTVQPYAMGAYRPNNFNFSAVEVTVEDNTVTTGLANVITLEANGDNWNLKAEEGYLYAAGNSTTNKKNQMMVEDEPDADGNANAAIYISTDSMSIAFQGTNDRNFLRFNYNNGNPALFSCYAVSSPVQTPAYIFKANVEPAGLRGDVNNDKNVTIADVTALIDYLLSGSAEGINTQNANCNLDEGITIADVTVLIDYLLSGNW